MNDEHTYQSGAVYRMWVRDSSWVVCGPNGVVRVSHDVDNPHRVF